MSRSAVPVVAPASGATSRLHRSRHNWMSIDHLRRRKNGIPKWVGACVEEVEFFGVEQLSDVCLSAPVLVATVRVDRQN